MSDFIVNKIIYTESSLFWTLLVYIHMSVQKHKKLIVRNYIFVNL